MDTQEERSGIPQELKSLLGNDSIQIQRLDTGDYAWYDIDGNLILIERKNINDLLSSIADDRLVEQVGRLRESADFALILIEGALQMLKDGKLASINQVLTVMKGGKVLGIGEHTNWYAGSVYSKLWSVVFGAGVSIIPVMGKATSAKVIETFYKASQQEAYGGRRWKGTRWNSTEPNIVLQMYTAILPRCGLELSRRIAKIYPSFEHLCTATLEDLCKIEGIGKLTAKGIYDALHTKYLP